MQDLQQETDLFGDLRDFLRDEDGPHTDALVALLRDGVSKDEIRTWLEEREKDRLSAEAAARRYRVLSIQSLSDIPPVTVPAKPWTRLTDDNHLVSQLVSLFLTRSLLGIHHFLDQDLFVRDMMAGNVDSEHCSPLLVNAILAYGCVSNNFRARGQNVANARLSQQYSTNPSAFAHSSDDSTRGMHFFDEAIRLWHAEAFCPRTTTLQAMTCLIIV